MRIRNVSGRTETGHLMLEHVGVPAEADDVVDAMAAWWAERQGWTDVKVSRPGAGALMGNVHHLLDHDAATALAAAWEVVLATA